MNDLIIRLNAPHLRPLVLESESPASPEGMTSSILSNEEKITEMERTLISTFDPIVIKDTLSSLHGATSGRKFHNLCHQWELSNLYLSTIAASTKDTLSSDCFAILFAKAQMCCRDQDYAKAKKIIYYIYVSILFENVNEFRITAKPVIVQRLDISWSGTALFRAISPHQSQSG